MSQIKYEVRIRWMDMEWPEGMTPDQIATEYSQALIQEDEYLQRAWVARELGDCERRWLPYTECCTTVEEEDERAIPVESLGRDSFIQSCEDEYNRIGETNSALFHSWEFSA